MTQSGSSGLDRIFLSKQRAGSWPTAAELAFKWRQERWNLICSAIAAERWSFSHRQAANDRHPTRIGRYGSAVLACRRGGFDHDRYRITSGWNFKLREGRSRLIQYHPEADYKLCSEPDAVMQAIGLGFHMIYGLALFSNNTQAEDVSGVFCNIQQPCAACREFLASHLSPSSPVMLIRHRLPCDLDQTGHYLSETGERSRPETFCAGDLVVEDWTFGTICRYHENETGQR